MTSQILDQEELERTILGLEVAVQHSPITLDELMMYGFLGAVLANQGVNFETFGEIIGTPEGIDWMTAAKDSLRLLRATEEKIKDESEDE